MKLWKNNRVDQEWQLDNAEIIRQFKESKWNKEPYFDWPFERRFLVFIMEDLRSVFDQNEYRSIDWWHLYRTV